MSSIVAPMHVRPCTIILLATAHVRMKNPPFDVAMLDQVVSANVEVILSLIKEDVSAMSNFALLQRMMPAVVRSAIQDSGFSDVAFALQTLTNDNETVEFTEAMAHKCWETLTSLQTRHEPGLDANAYAFAALMLRTLGDAVQAIRDGMCWQVLLVRLSKCAKEWWSTGISSETFTFFTKTGLSTQRRLQGLAQKKLEQLEEAASARIKEK